MKLANVQNEACALTAVDGERRAKQRGRAGRGKVGSGAEAIKGC